MDKEGSAAITEEDFETCMKLKDSTNDETEGWEHMTTCTVAGCRAVIHRRERKSAANGLYEYKCFATLPFRAQQLCDVCTRVDYRKTWDKYVLDAKILEEGENGESCLYWAVKFPWPMANRDYVYRRCIKTNQEEGTIALVFKGGPHPDAPEIKNLIRVEDYDSYFLLVERKPSAEEQEKMGREILCDFYMLYFDDLKGSIPKVLINWAISTGIPDYIKKLVQACENYADYLANPEGFKMKKLKKQETKKKTKNGQKEENT